MTVQPTDAHEANVDANTARRRKIDGKRSTIWHGVSVAEIRAATL